MKNLWLFRSYLWKYKKRILLLACLILSSAFFEGLGIGLFFPLIEFIQEGESALSGGKFVLLFDVMKQIGVKPNVVNFILIIFFVIISSFALVYATNIVSVLTYNPIMKQIRDDGFRNILDSPMQYYHTISSGKIVGIFIGEVEYVGQSINYLISIVVKTISILIYSFFAFFISWQLTLVVIFIALVRYKVLGLFIEKSRKVGAWHTRIVAMLNSYLVGIYQGIDVIKTYATEEKERGRFKHMTRDFLDNVNQSAINVANSRFVGDSLGIGLVCIIIYLSISWFYLPGTSILVFLFIIVRLTPHVAAINDARIRLAEYTSGIVYLKTIFDYSTDKEIPLQYWGTIDKTDIHHDITFNSMNFSYLEDASFAIKDINFSIAKNETMAIVGESGAGKTTFIRLLLRLYKPNSGTIFIDGVSIEDISRQSWRRLVSVVSQDTFVFDDTIENNIKYSVEQCSNDEFWTAVQRAKAEEFINELPEKEKTELGERGIKLSGGQRQRIAIARAFLRDSPIMILDEATSALDSVTESLIQKALNDLAKNRTMIIIAHRLSTIKNADRIAVFDKGKILEIGTHKELLENGSLYSKYHNLQIY